MSLTNRTGWLVAGLLSCFSIFRELQTYRAKKQIDKEQALPIMLEKLNAKLKKYKVIVGNVHCYLMDPGMRNAPEENKCSKEAFNLKYELLEFNAHFPEKIKKAVKDYIKTTEEMYEKCVLFRLNAGKVDLVKELKNLEDQYSSLSDLIDSATI